MGAPTTGAQARAQSRARKKARAPPTSVKPVSRFKRQATPSQARSPALQRAESRLKVLKPGTTGFALQQEEIRRLKGQPSRIKITPVKQPTRQVRAQQLLKVAQRQFNTLGGRSPQFRETVRRINSLGFQPNVINIRRAEGVLRQSDIQSRIRLKQIKPEAFMGLPIPSIPRFRTSVNGRMKPKPKSELQKVLTGTKDKKKFGGIAVTKIPTSKDPVVKASQVLARESKKSLQRTQELRRRKGGALTVPDRLVLGIIVPAVFGVARAGVGLANVLVHPIKAVKSVLSAVTHPARTLKTLGGEFVVDPVGVTVEFIAFSKGLNIIGKGARVSRVGRFVQEEMFIRAQPRILRPVISSILKSANIQKAINPFKIPSIKKVDLFEIKSLTRLEAKVIGKTIRDTDSVIFGSVVGRTLSRKRTPLPKDVDIATRSVEIFNKKFIKNLPPKARGNYLIKRQKIVRKSNGQALLDIKPIGRLFPQRSFLTGKARLPVVGFVKKIKGIQRLRDIKIIRESIDLIKTKLTSKKLTPKTRRRLNKQLKKLNKRFRKLAKPLPLSELPKIIKRLGVAKLTLPTQKLVKVGGIKLTGFGEQTMRKALGTLQVLLEKNVRRAKDPQSLLIGLEIQVQALKIRKPTTLLAKRLTQAKIKRLSDTIRLLKSKAFSKLLESKVPGITKSFPLVNKITVSKLKKVKSTPALKIRKLLKKRRDLLRKKVKAKVPKKVKPTTALKIRKALAKKKAKVKKKAPKVKAKKKIKLSGLPLARLKRTPLSRLAPSTLSKIPASKLPKSILSKLPAVSLLSKSRLPPSRLRKLSKIPASRIPKSILSKLPLSRIPKPLLSKIPISAIPKTILSKIPVPPPSKIPPSKPPSKIPPLRPPSVLPPIRPPSRLPPPRPPIKPPPKKTRLKEFFKDPEKAKKVFLPNIILFRFTPDLASRILDIRATAKERKALLRGGRIFTGFEQRKLV